MMMEVLGKSFPIQTIDLLNSTIETKVPLNIPMTTKEDLVKKYGL